MKKEILFIALLTASFTQAQSLNSSNEPTIGEFVLMYECDTLTDNYDGITGTGITWDYSQIAGLNGGTKTISVIDPATTDSAAHFTTSTKAMSIENSLINYFNSTGTERVSQGFVYQEPNFGTVLATFETDEQITIQYPFAYSDYFSDAFAGSLAFEFNGIPQNPNCSGTSYSYIDGQGTLLLPGSTTVSDVIRYKIVDTVFTTVIFVVPLDIEFVRTQYEYYDVANSNLPLFTHSSVMIQQQGATTPLVEQTIVLSSVAPDFGLGLTVNELNSITIYPNPSQGTIQFKGNFESDARATVFDNSGRLVTTLNSLQNGQNIDISYLNKGIYQIVIENNGVITSDKVILQ